MTGRIPFWVDLAQVPDDQRDATHAAATQAGVDRIIDGPTKDATRITIHSVADQKQAADADGTVIIDADDWTIIPLENLIAARRDRPGTLFAVAHSCEEAVRFRHVLDVGVHGIVLAPKRPEDVQETADALLDAGERPDDQATPEQTASIQLIPATIQSVADVESAERVCIDCTARFQDGEGLLVGSTAASFILVHAETIQTEYVNARPFRVNAGAVHSYILGLDDHTSYLSEAAAGGQVLAVGTDGNTRPLTIGRAKIEHRPHALVSWTSDAGTGGSAVVQFAETIRFIHPEGTPVAVTQLKAGDKVLVHDAGGGRHMGMPVQERVREQ